VFEVVENPCEVFTERDMMRKAELQRFCSTDAGRQSIHEPWLVGGKTLATNGRIIVAADGELDGVSANPDAPSKAALDLFVEPPAGSTFMGIPGVNEDECDDCDGSGVVECLCPECSNVYERKCKTCSGMGYAYTPDKVQIGERTFSGYNIYKMRDLEDVQIHIEGDRHSACYFTFTGGCGVVMPIRQGP